MQLQKQIPKTSIRNIVIPRMESSAWFAHPENIILTLLASSDEEERRFCVRVILDKIRKGGQGKTGVRSFRVPTLNWKALTLKELIDWNEVEVTEPIITACMSSEDLVKFLDTPLVVPDWTCHTQAVERTVKKVTEASKMVAGQEKKMDGLEPLMKAECSFLSWNLKRIFLNC